MPQDVCIGGMALEKERLYNFWSSVPRIARTEEPFSVACQLLISPQAGYPPSRIVPWGPSN